MAEQSRPKDDHRHVVARPKQKTQIIVPNDTKAHALAWPGQMPSANRTAPKPQAGRDAQRVRAMSAAAKQK
jgi:hypothetical protein